MWDVIASGLGSEIAQLVDGRDYDEYRVDPAFIGRTGELAQKARADANAFLVGGVVEEGDQAAFAAFVSSLIEMSRAAAALVTWDRDHWRPLPDATEEDARAWAEAIDDLHVQIDDLALSEIADGELPGGSTRPN